MHAAVIIFTAPGRKYGVLIVYGTYIDEELFGGNLEDNFKGMI
jgi:hypothetical protein